MKFIYIVSQNDMIRTAHVDRQRAEIIKLNLKTLLPNPGRIWIQEIQLEEEND